MMNLLSACGKSAQRCLKIFKQDCPDHAAQSQMPLCVQIGGLSKRDLLTALYARGIKLNPLGIALFEHPGFATQTTRELLDIACVSVAELGLPDGGSYAEIVQAAMQADLVECPIELGPHLRIAFLCQEEIIAFGPVQNQAPPGAITVASPPLDTDEATPRGFYLRCYEGSLWLRGFRSWPGHVWRAEDQFVFAKPMV
jgi:hypothetical protein